MAAEALKKFWKNEYFQAALTIALIFVIVFGFYFGAQIILGTEYPALAVASGSMLPTLNIGDLIIVQKVDPAQIKADKFTGDVLVFRDPRNPTELIVHRAVDITEYKGGHYLITTLGDNMHGEKDQFSPWDSSLLIGKVVARIPYLGNLPLLFHSERNMYIFILAILVILAILMLLSSFGDEVKPLEENKKLWKIDLRLIHFIAINLLILGFLFFTLWGSFTFWQPGASPPQATIRGMYADLQFHESFSNEAYLHQGFVTYRIDCQVSGGTRLGISTFSWFQFLILILVLFNARKLVDFVRSWRTKSRKNIF
ncbi:MAG: signal peptidase I [Candidatus Bathyarchaeia archaeon]